MKINPTSKPKKKRTMMWVQSSFVFFFQTKADNHRLPKKAC
jgi:hypothetical protein